MSATKQPFFWATGRRKTAVARVRLAVGDGKIVVNSREPERYFPHVGAIETLRAPLAAVGCEKTVDLFIHTDGGGVSSQAGAAQLGIARALVRSNSDYEEILRDRKFLTRDSRKKERKKYGRAGARRSFQFSKR
jgi:small subunit ribosomal protein S9